MKNTLKIRGVFAFVLVFIMIFTGGINLYGTCYAVTQTMEETSSETDTNLTLSKDANPMGINEWEITLTAKGRVTQSKTSDIVLLLDRSDSMNGDKLKKAKKAAIQFIDQLLDENGKTRISVLTFNKGTEGISGFTNRAGSADLKTAINKISHYNGSGTNIQNAIHVAREILRDQSKAEIKTIVIVGDGEPTYSHKITSLSGITYTCPSEEHQEPVWNYNQFVYKFDYDLLAGNGRFYEVDDNQKRTVNVPCQNDPKVSHTLKYPANNGLPTIYEAELAKKEGTGIFAVGIGMNDNGEFVLRSCQNRGYVKQNIDDNTFDFSSIADKIGAQACGAEVTDPINGKFQLMVDGSFDFAEEGSEGAANADVIVSQGTSVLYDASSATLSWSIGRLNPEVPATLKYKVKAKPGVIFQDDKTYPTNGRTYLSYLLDGNTVTRDFEVPMVQLTGGAITTAAIEVNSSNQPIDAAGKVVGDYKNAKKIENPVRIPQADSYFVYGDILVSKGGITGYDYKGYVREPDGGKGIESQLTVTLSPQNNTPVVYFLYQKGTGVVPVTPGGGNNSNKGSSGGGSISITTETPQLEKKDHFAYAVGYPDGTVRPLGSITREEVAVIFYRLMMEESRRNYESESCNFSDVPASRWSRKEISTLVNAGILKGYPDGSFRPSNPITRAEFAVISSKFDKLDQTDVNRFTDINDHWAKAYINSSALKGWINGYADASFRPDRAIIRCEAMKLINEVLDRRVDLAGIHSDAKVWPDNTSEKWYYEIVMEATNSHDYERKEKAKSIEKWTKIKANPVW